MFMSKFYKIFIAILDILIMNFVWFLQLRERESVTRNKYASNIIKNQTE